VSRFFGLRRKTIKYAYAYFIKRKTFADFLKFLLPSKILNFQQVSNRKGSLFITHYTLLIVGDSRPPYGGFVIGSQGRETSEGAKIALQIDFELKTLQNTPLLGD
jgi:hypothetical protein